MVRSGDFAKVDISIDAFLPFIRLESWTAWVHDIIRVMLVTFCGGTYSLVCLHSIRICCVTGRYSLRYWHSHFVISTMLGTIGVWGDTPLGTGVPVTVLGSIGFWGDTSCHCGFNCVLGRYSLGNCCVFSIWEWGGRCQLVVCTFRAHRGVRFVTLRP